MLDIWFGHLPPGLNKGYLTLAPCWILIIWFGQLPSGLSKRISHLGAMLDIWFGQLSSGLNERYLTRITDGLYMLWKEEHRKLNSKTWKCP